MDLTTTYMGRQLRSPLVASSGPPTAKLDSIKRLEDCGIGAVVLPSIFEEQIVHEREELHRRLSVDTEGESSSMTYFPEPDDFLTAPDQYLDLLRAAKEACDIPVIASLNGYTMDGWTSFAPQLESAGADAIELNIYNIPTDPDKPGSLIEQMYMEVLQTVRLEIDIPIAMKIGPFFSNIANMAKQLQEAGANALVLFNRFYQPDISLEEGTVFPHLTLTSEHELRLPMTWIGILYGKLPIDLAASRAVYSGRDALKLIMAGASVTMMTSALIRHGAEHVQTVEQDLIAWMNDHEVDSLDQIRGSLSQFNCPDPRAFERAQYISVLKST